jgi:hypothetical protein
MSINVVLFEGTAVKSFLSDFATNAGTSSYALNAGTASVLIGSIQSSSYSAYAVTSSYALTALNALNAGVSPRFSASAFYVSGGLGDQYAIYVDNNQSTYLSNISGSNVHIVGNWTGSFNDGIDDGGIIYISNITSSLIGVYGKYGIQFGQTPAAYTFFVATNTLSGSVAINNSGETAVNTLMLVDDSFQLNLTAHNIEMLVVPSASGFFNLTAEYKLINASQFSGSIYNFVGDSTYIVIGESGTANLPAATVSGDSYVRYDNLDFNNSTGSTGTGLYGYRNSIISRYSNIDNLYGIASDIQLIYSGTVNHVYGLYLSNINQEWTITTSSYAIYVAENGGKQNSYLSNITASNALFTGSISASGAITASAFRGFGSQIIGVISSSYATSASWAPGSGAAISASYATTSSYASVAQTLLGTITSASYALTASFALNGGTGASNGVFGGNFSGSFSGSIIGSGSLIGNTSGSHTGSFVGSGSGIIGIISASYATNAGSANNATNATSASFATNSIGATTAQTASLAVTSSYAIVAQTLLGTITSASYAQTASVVTGTISTASLAVLAQTAITASYVLQAVSASYATTASYAVNATNVNGIVTASFFEAFQTTGSWGYGTNFLVSNTTRSIGNDTNFLYNKTPNLIYFDNNPNFLANPVNASVNQLALQVLAHGFSATANVSGSSTIGIGVQTQTSPNTFGLQPNIAQLIGISSYASTGTTHTGSVNEIAGVIAGASVFSSGTYARISAQENYLYISSGNVGTYGHGNLVYMEIGGGSNVSNLYGVDIWPFFYSTAGIGNYYGLYIRQNAGGKAPISSSYAIFVEGTQQSVLGNISASSTTVANNLVVGGQVSLGSLVALNPSTATYKNNFTSSITPVIFTSEILGGFPAVLGISTTGSVPITLPTNLFGVNYGGVGVLGAAGNANLGRVQVGVMGYAEQAFTTNLPNNYIIGGYFQSQLTGSAASNSWGGNAYGIYAISSISSSLSSSGNVYGGSFVAVGQANLGALTGSQQTTYGIYANATGGDVNWAGYFDWNTFAKSLVITPYSQGGTTAVWTIQGKAFNSLVFPGDVSFDGGKAALIAVGGAFSSGSIYWPYGNFGSISTIIAVKGGGGTRPTVGQYVYATVDGATGGSSNSLTGIYVLAQPTSSAYGWGNSIYGIGGVADARIISSSTNAGGVGPALKTGSLVSVVGLSGQAFGVSGALSIGVLGTAQNTVVGGIAYGGYFEVPAANVGPKFGLAVGTGSVAISESLWVGQTGSFGYIQGIGTGVNGIISSSYAVTSSYATLAQNVLGSITSASYALTSSYATLAQNVLGTITSASYAQTASVVLGSISTASLAFTANTASYVLQAVSASYATTSSYALVAQTLLGSITSASYASTASLAFGLAPLTTPISSSGLLISNSLPWMTNGGLLISTTTHSLANNPLGYKSPNVINFNTALIPGFQAGFIVNTFGPTGASGSGGNVIGAAIDATVLGDGTANQPTSSWVVGLEVDSAVNNLYTGSLGVMYGTYNGFNMNGSATGSYIIGNMNLVAATNGKFNTVGIAGIYSNVVLSGQVSSSNVYGLFVDNTFLSTVTIGNYYGIYLRQIQQTGLPTQRNFAIFVEGNQASSLAFITASNATFNGNVVITGSLTASNSITAPNFFGSSSYATNAGSANNATSASFATNSIGATTAQTASFVLQAVSASFATTASYSKVALSASYATTSSYIDLYQTGSSGLELNLQKYADVMSSAGQIIGGELLVINSGSYYVNSGSGFSRIANDQTSHIQYFQWSASTTQSLGPGSSSFVGVSYNAASPTVIFRNSYNFDYETEIPLGYVVRGIDGLDVFASSNPHSINDAVGTAERRIYETLGPQRDSITGGLILGESGTGTMAVTVSSGSWWSRYNRFTFTGLDTSLSGSNWYDSYYRAATPGNWTRIPSQSIWDNAHYDDGTGVLGNLSGTQKSNLWFYLDATNKIAMVYGRTNNGNLANTQAEGAPNTLPPRLQYRSILLGRIIFQRNQTTSLEVDSAFTNTFAFTATTDHNSLSGLQGGTLGEYYHFTSASYAILQAGSSSYAPTASYALVAQTLLGSVVSASYATTASYAQTALSASWAPGTPTTSASYADVAKIVSPNIYVRTAGDTMTGALQMSASIFSSASVLVTGSVNVRAGVSQSVPVAIAGTTSQVANLTEWNNAAGTLLAAVSPTGIYLGSASYAINAGSANNATSASFATTSSAATSITFTVVSASYATNSANANTATSASFATNAIGATTAQTASIVQPNIYVRTAGDTMTGILQMSASIFTSSSIIQTGSHQIRAGVSQSVPLAIAGTTSQVANLTEWDNAAGTLLAAVSASGLFVGSASYAINAGSSNNATSASFATNAIGATTAQTASFVLSASYATNAGSANNATSASFATNSIGSTTAQTASLAVTSSYAIVAQTLLGSITSASYATTASYASVAQTLLGSVVSASYASTASLVAPNIYVRTAGDTMTGALQMSASIFSSASIIDTGSIMIMAGVSQSVPLTIDGTTSQVANLTEWGTNAGTTLSAINASGQFVGTASVAISASWAPGGGPAVSASYASTASIVAPNIYVRTAGDTMTGILQMSASIFSSSSIIQTGSHQIRAGVSQSVPLSIGGTTSQVANLTEWRDIAGTLLASVSPTGIYLGSASYATNAASANNATSSSFATTASAATSITFVPISASYAVTASAIAPFKYVQLVGDVMTGALQMSASIFTSASVLGTGSVNFKAQTSSSIVSSFTGFTAQVSNLTEWRNAAGTVLSSVSASGLFVGSASFALTSSAATSLTFTPVTASYASTSSLSRSTRQTVTVTSPSIGPNTQWTGSVEMGTEQWTLFIISGSHNSRLRLYTNSSSMKNDLTRSVNIQPSASTGVLLDAVVTGSRGRYVGLSPVVVGYNFEGLGVSNTVMNVSINSQEAASASISYVFTYVSL